LADAAIAATRVAMNLASAATRGPRAAAARMSKGA